MPEDLPEHSPSILHDADCHAVVGGLTITNHRTKSRSYDVISSDNRFVDIAFRRFDLAQVCAILAHNNASFKGHKDALAAALCGWMLGHRHPYLRRRSVGLSIGTTFARAEQAALKKFAERPEEGKLPRTTRLPQTFFSELYYPIGGLSYILKIPPRYGLRHEMRTQRNRLHHTMTIAAIDHCYYCLSNDHILEEISVDRSCEIVNLIELTINNVKSPNVNNLEYEYLDQFDRSLPFLYAASTMRYSETESLLDAIANAKWASILKPGVIHELFGRALYYAQNVYVLNKRKLSRSACVDGILRALRGIEPKPFKPLDRVTAHSEIVRYYYTKAGYAACHTDESKFYWQHEAFWVGLGLPVPKNQRPSPNISEKSKKLNVQNGLA